MADSVVRGNLTMAQWSSLFLLGVLFEDVWAASWATVFWATGSWVTSGSLFVAVDTFQHSFLGLKAFALASALGGQGLPSLPSVPSSWKASLGLYVFTLQSKGHLPPGCAYSGSTIRFGSLVCFLGLFPVLHSEPSAPRLVLASCLRPPVIPLPRLDQLDSNQSWFL